MTVCAFNSFILPSFMYAKLISKYENMKTIKICTYAYGIFYMFACIAGITF